MAPSGKEMVRVQLLEKGLALATVTVFFSLLITITYTDIRTMKIPNKLNAAVFFTGGASVFLLQGPSLAERIAGVFVISVPMLLLTFFVPDGFGAGDIKLMAASGLFMGMEGNITATMIGFVLGGAWGLALLLGKKAGRKDVFAFGPFLCAGLALSFLILCTKGSYSIL